MSLISAFLIILFTNSITNALQPSPLVAWRSSASLTPTKLHVPTLASDTLLSTLDESNLWEKQHICALTDNKVKIVMVLQQNVYAVDMTDRPTIPAFQLIKKSYEQANIGMEVPHFGMSSTKSSVDSVQENMKQLFVSYIADMNEPCVGFSFDTSVITTELPELGSENSNPDLVKEESEIKLVQQLMDQHKEALFIYIGIPNAQLNTLSMQEQLTDPISQLQASNEIVPIISLSYIAIYQIFSPALFMSFSVFILLVSILLVGISWLSSIKVPTGGLNSMKRPKSIPAS